MNIKKIKSAAGKIRSLRFNVVSEKGVYIGKNCSLKGGKNILFSENVTIRPYVQIWGGRVQIGQGSEIGERSRISVANFCEIGSKVLLSPNVYITDCDHDYRDIDMPIMEQGIIQRGQKVLIGDGSFVGINSVILGNVTIGRHCVIGANSVVTTDIPDNCVAVGCPAKIIKKYDRESKIWKRTEE